MRRAGLKEPQGPFVADRYLGVGLDYLTKRLTSIKGTGSLLRFNGFGPSPS